MISYDPYDLETETDELDWVKGCFPVKFRKPEVDEDLSQFSSHHIKWRKLKKGEDPKNFPDNLVKLDGRDFFTVARVPMEYDGIQSGDKVAMVLGGFGDKLAFAISRQGEKIDAEVWRIPPFSLKENRGEWDKEEDAKTLADLFWKRQELFRKVEVRDRELILLKETWISLQDAMKARIACEQRLRQHFIGEIFCSEDGGYPEGDIELAFDKVKANDRILLALREEESRREKSLVKIIGKLSVYNDLFLPIKGVGPKIAARIITAVGDIRRFPTASKLKAFCGCHVLFEFPLNGKTVVRKLLPGEAPNENPRFARKRTGELANWHNEARQGLYLVGDQFNRRPDTIWGQKLLEYKAKFREKHPEVIVGANGKKKYTNAHIHKMAIWRTLTKFVEWLWREWTRLEKPPEAEKLAA
ncbi:MAG: transposase [Parcubacteria group bacterium]